MSSPTDAWPGAFKLSRVFCAALLLLLVPTLTSAQISVTPVVTNLDRPLAITHARDGRLFIVLQAGRVLVHNGSVTSTFLDITSLVKSDTGEEGLLSIAFPPNYASSGFFYVFYTNKSGDNVVAAYSVSANPDVANPAGTPLLTIPHPVQSNHNGGQLAFGPDGFLYIGSGDGGAGNDPPNNAQNLNVLLGKILRLAVSGASAYTIPPGNPYANDGNANTLAEIWSYGLRNPWRFSFDRQTGDLFIGDVGQSAREEVNFQAAGAAGGANYGWRVMEGTLCTGLGGGPPCFDASLTPPILEYSHTLGCSVTGGYVYRGTKTMAPGTYIYGDFCTGRIWGATRSGNTWSTTELLDTTLNISTFGEDEAGEIYVTHHGSGTGGAVYRIVAIDSDGDGLPNWWESAHFNSPTAAIAGADPDNDLFTNLQEFIAATNPNDSDSRLRISSVVRTGNDMRISWQTAFGKKYQLFRNPNLEQSANWTLIRSVTGTGGVVKVTDSGAGGGARQFYRVVALP